jgi:molybdate transport system permease protein
VASAALLVAAFFALPLVGLVQKAAWSHLGRDLSTPEATHALRLSITSSLWATALSVCFGLPLAWVLARTDLPGRHLLRGLVLLPMVLPPVVAGIALLSALSLRSPVGGWLHDAFGIQFTFSPLGVVTAETFVSMPFFVITAEAALRSIDQRLEQAAAGLGASRATVFRRVTLPLAAPGVAAGAVLAWARALGEFGATVTFAGNIAGRTQTLPLSIYLQLEGHPDTSIALSLVLLAVSFTVLVTLRDRWLGQP